MLVDEEGLDMRLILIEHPRCGLSWIRTFLYLMGIKDVEYSHDGMGQQGTIVKDLEARLSWKQLPVSDHRYKGNRFKVLFPHQWKELSICFLVRDPRDAVMSNFHGYNYWGRVKTGQDFYKDFSLFIRSPEIGIVPLLRWWQWWEKHINESGKWRTMYFEETKKDHYKAFSELLKFGDYSFSESKIRQQLKGLKTAQQVKEKAPKNIKLINTSDGKTDKWRAWIAGDQAWAIEQMKKYPSSFSERYR